MIDTVYWCPLCVNNEGLVELIIDEKKGEYICPVCMSIFDNSFNLKEEKNE